MACSAIPLNIISTLLYPLLYLSTYDDEIDWLPFDLDQRVVNKFITTCLYLPNAIIFTGIFAAFSVVMVPFAYLNTVFYLFGQCVVIVKNKCDDICNRFSRLLFWIIFGLPVLVFTWLIEIPIFFKNLFILPQHDSYVSDIQNLKKITLNGLSVLDEISHGFLLKLNTELAEMPYEERRDLS